MGSVNFNDFIKGLIQVRLEGLSIERFINICAINNIILYEIRRTQFTAIEFKIKSSDFKRLKSIVKKTSSRARIIKKNNFAMLMNKILRRKFFLFGITLFLIIIFYLSNIIWSVEINGTKKISNELIHATLKKYGIQQGRMKTNLKLKKIEAEVLSEIKEISIITIKLQGTRAVVEIVERTMPPEIVASNIPTNIVALKDGIIIKILSYSGQPVVKEGDFVKKGQILITGILTDKANVPSKMVNSMGIVNAKTWYETIAEQETNYMYEKRTGRLKKKVYYNIMGGKVCVKNARIDFPNYDKIEIKNSIKIGSLNTPIEKITEVYYEKIFDSITLTKEEAVELAIKRAEEEIIKLLPNTPKILEKKIEKDIIGSKAVARVLYILNENIGVKEEIK